MPAPTTLRTYAYVDGFNLYYRALKGTPYKWLDLRSLLQGLLRPQNRLDAIRYYTARVSSRVEDRDAPKRQHAYLSALKTVQEVSIHYGIFLPKIIRRPLLHSPSKSSPTYVQVLDTEEKGSDVNLASHLLWDGFRGLYDVAVVVSKDTDLVEPIRIVAQELKKPVGLICPDNQVPGGLKKVVSFIRHVTAQRLATAQMTNPVTALDGKLIFKPKSW